MCQFPSLNLQKNLLESLTCNMSCLVSIQDTCAQLLANNKLKHHTVRNLSDPNLIYAGSKKQDQQVIEYLMLK